MPGCEVSWFDTCRIARIGVWRKQFAASATGCTNAGPCRSRQKQIPTLVLGFANVDRSIRPDFFVVGWDNTLHAARWVAWAVTQGDLGQAKRKNNFREDHALPSGFFRVGPQDYAHSGYDRGHFCPSGDRTKNPEQNSNTFVMTNMHPQRHALNAGPWEKLEEATRSALQLPDDVAYVVAGALYEKDAALLGRGVPVPSHSWKTVVWTKTSVTPKQLPANSVSTTVLMPNEEARDGDSFVQYKTTIAQVESLSHLRLLTSLEPAVQIALRAGDLRK
jgi:endonuclease G, mitochondrial